MQPCYSNVARSVHTGVVSIEKIRASIPTDVALVWMLENHSQRCSHATSGNSISRRVTSCHFK